MTYHTERLGGIDNRGEQFSHYLHLTAAHVKFSEQCTQIQVNHTVQNRGKNTDPENVTNVTRVSSAAAGG